MARKRRKTPRRIPISRYSFSPSTYPGRRPRFSFLFTPKGIYRLKLRSLGRFLADRKLPGTDKRYAVLAYGSNACPTRLLKKYREDSLSDVPVLYGRLSGAQAVWARRRTKAPIAEQYIPSTLAREKGSRSSWITFLTKEQVTAMDASEGRPGSYELAELRGVDFFLGKKKVFPLYAYVNIRGGVMTQDGRAVSLHTTSQRSARQMFDQTIEQPATDWLTFNVIPYPDPPPRFSQMKR